LLASIDQEACFFPGPLPGDFRWGEAADNSFCAYRFSRKFFIHLAVEAQRIG
jgi:hypothetical protein